jgi:spermidine/putrescine transport system permease protein
MRSGIIVKLATGSYLVLFFAYLFAPLVIMSATAFNSTPFPTVYPFECLTFEWFGKLYQDARLRAGLRYTVIIGASVVFLSVLLGLAGALLLTQIRPRLRAACYTVLTAPILMPGVVIGIATVLFWRRSAQGIGADPDGLVVDGIFLTSLGQSSFIASYCMLLFIARLQRFDMGLMEAALDLGASHAQAFRKILLPFLRPAIFSAAAIAFLASFENYNTSVFTIATYNTFTIEVAQKVRLGLDPSISALAFLVILLTLFGALAHEAYAHHAARIFQRGSTAGKAGVSFGRIGDFFLGNPAAVLASLVLAATLSTSLFALRHNPQQCKAEAFQRKLEIQQKYAAPTAPPATPGQPQPGMAEGAGSILNPGRGSFGDVFGSGIVPGAPVPPQPQPEGPDRSPGQQLNLAPRTPE